MPNTKPAERTSRISARITPKTADQIEDLKALWGAGQLRPLTPATIAEVAIDRAWRAEMGRRKKSGKNPDSGGPPS